VIFVVAADQKAACTHAGASTAAGHMTDGEPGATARHGAAADAARPPADAADGQAPRDAGACARVRLFAVGL
jgi:hypothetical protein